MVRREESMHCLAVKSCKLVDSDNNNIKTVCPKPRRLGPAAGPEFLKLPICSKHSQQSDDGRSGILNIIAEKTSIEGREVKCNGCSTSCYYSGSPPKRTENPVVQDVHFIHQMELLSPPFARSKLSASQIWPTLAIGGLSSLK